MKNIFKGKYVQLTLKVTISKSSYEDGVGGEITKPLAMAAYFIKEDTTYMYLGDDPDEITIRVDKKNVSFMEVLKVEDEYDKLLEETSKSNYTN